MELETEHHPALGVLGDMAVRHPQPGVRDVQQDVDRLAGSHEHCVFPDNLRAEWIDHEQRARSLAQPQPGRSGWNCNETVSGRYRPLASLFVAGSGGILRKDAIALDGYWVRSSETGDALKPLTISHTPMNSSHKPPGIVWMRLRLKPITSNTDPPRMTA